MNKLIEKAKKNVFKTTVLNVPCAAKHSCEGQHCRHSHPYPARYRFNGDKHPHPGQYLVGFIVLTFRINELVVSSSTQKKKNDTMVFK